MGLNQQRDLASAQFLEALLANASDGIVACDADGHLVLFNLAAQAFHGMPPEPILQGRGSANDPEDWARFYDLYDSLFREATPTRWH
jgi:PAS domain-containing protein